MMHMGYYSIPFAYPHVYTSTLLAASFGFDVGLDKDLADYIMKTIDKDESGTIDFVEFITYIPFFIRLHLSTLERPMDGLTPNSAADIIRKPNH